MQHLSTNTIDPVGEVCITTIQRLFSILQGEPDSTRPTRSRLAVRSWRERPATSRCEVVYNPALPIETFDVDHHRRVPPLDLRPLAAGAGVLRRPPDRPHRDAPSRPSVLQSEPRDGVHPRAGRRRRRQRRLRRLPHPAPQITEGGSTSRGRRRSSAMRDRQTRKVRWEELDDDLDLRAERSSTAPSSPRTRSAPSSAPSRTSSSPRSSPAAARCRRR